MEVTTARVVNSTPIELVTLSYEVILENIEASIDNIKNKKEYNIEISKLLIRNLMNALDMKFDISKKLMSLYIYINGELINSDITKDNEKKINILNECKNLLSKIYYSFKIISDNENKKESVMKNTDAIYSGLTYGISGLNETVLGSSNKGLKA